MYLCAALPRALPAPRASCPVPRRHEAFQTFYHVTHITTTLDKTHTPHTQHTHTADMKLVALIPGVFGSLLSPRLSPDASRNQPAGGTATEQPSHMLPFFPQRSLCATK